MLKEDRLLNLIVREAREDKKIKKGDSVYKSRKGYIAHIINLCIKLKELSQTNSTIKKLTESNSILTQMPSLRRSSRAWSRKNFTTLRRHWLAMPWEKISNMKSFSKKMYTYLYLGNHSRSSNLLPEVPFSCLRPRARSPRQWSYQHLASRSTWGTRKTAWVKHDR